MASHFGRRNAVAMHQYYSIILFGLFTPLGPEYFVLLQNEE